MCLHLSCVRTQILNVVPLRGTQVNHLSPSLLGLLLLPLLVNTDRRFNTRPRVVIVTSDLHQYATFEEDIINSPRPLRDYAHKDNVKKSLV